MQMHKNEQIELSGQSIFAGKDVHKKSWMVSVYTEEVLHKTFITPQSRRL